MRSFLLAVVGLAVLATPASAAVLTIEFEDCACDPSSGDVGSTTLVVRAAPGEVNRMSLVGTPGGSVVVKDDGAALRGCKPAPGGGRLCDDPIDGVALELGDGEDSVDVRGIGAEVDPGPGDDVVTASGASIYLYPSPGADRLDMAPDSTAVVSYIGRTNNVTVRMNGLPDDGEAGEGDDLRGRITSMWGGSGDDVLEAGADPSSLQGGAGRDTLTGGPAEDRIQADEGDDRVDAGGGDDQVWPGPGRDTLLGGPGRDLAFYDRLERAGTLRIAPGPAAGDGDDAMDAIEGLVGGRFDDTLIGDDGPNVLTGGPGRDTVIGGAGDDLINGGSGYGIDGGDMLDPGPGRDRVRAARGDRVLLADGEQDRLACQGAPEIVADPLDVATKCAPSVFMRLARGSDVDAGVVRIVVRCEARSAVDCRGRLGLLRRGRAASTRPRFGPIAPGRRQVVRVRLLGRPPRRGACLDVRAITRRQDVESSTSSKRRRIACG